MYKLQLTDWFVAYSLFSKVNVCESVPGFSSDEDLAGVHDPAGQAGCVDGAQRRAQLDDVGPDQRLRQQASMLPWRRGLVLTYQNTDAHRYTVIQLYKHLGS